MRVPGLCVLACFAAQAWAPADGVGCFSSARLSVAFPRDSCEVTASADGSFLAVHRRDYLTVAWGLRAGKWPDDDDLVVGIEVKPAGQQDAAAHGEVCEAMAPLVVAVTQLDDHRRTEVTLDKAQLADLAGGEWVSIEHALARAGNGTRAFTVELIPYGSPSSEIVPAIATVRFRVQWELSFSASREYDIYSKDALGGNSGVVHYLTVGRGTYGLLHTDFIIQSDYQWNITVGNFCSFASGTRIDLMRTSAHRKHALSTYPSVHLQTHGFPAGAGVPVANSVRSFTIGNDVWVGQNVVFINECSVGDGAIIGAESVVRGFIPPYAIAFGNPAMVTGFRFPETTVEALLQSRWWDAPDAEVARLFALDDIRTFVGF